MDEDIETILDVIDDYKNEMIDDDYKEAMDSLMHVHRKLEVKDGLLKCVILQRKEIKNLKWYSVFTGYLLLALNGLGLIKLFLF